MTSIDLVRTLRLRVKDKHASLLLEQAREVNFVWNYCNEMSIRILQRERRFCSNVDLDRLTAGATKEGLSLHSQTVQAISKEYVTRRRQFKRAKLRWRVSRGARRSLGWIPVKASALRYKAGQVWYCGRPISLWDSYGLADHELGAGSFSEDARGRWYLNITVKAKWPAVPKPQTSSALGIDLGLKDFLVASDGRSESAERFYRDLEPALAAAQRANKKKRVQAIHAKIAARRKDALHKLSTALVCQHGAIFVGNVNAAGLAKTKMAKSVLDAGWSAFRAMLQYKGDDAGAWIRDVNEAYSTQECSGCHSLTGPKGLGDLAVRQWRCSVCGAEHDRDLNAAINILRRGLSLLEQEFSAAVEAKAGEAAVNKDSRHQLMQSAAAAGLGHEPLAEGIPAL